MLEIQAFGNLAIRQNGDILDNLGSLKSRVILTYLAIEGGSLNRHSLAAMFWPESNEEKGLVSLRVALSALRKTVGDYLEINRETVSIKSGTSIYLDVYDFEEQLSQGNLDKAVELYRGDLLQGIFIQDSEEFESWRRWEQERLKLRLINSMQEKLKEEIKLGNIESAQCIARDLIKLDPLNEIAHQHFMITLALSGKRSSAVRHYQLFQRIVEDELGCLPTHETVELLTLIQDDNIAALTKRVLPKHNLPRNLTSFIGRIEEQDQIAELIKNPDCKLITLLGPGGVGKTRLAIETARKQMHLFVDGVYFIPLENVATPDDMISAIADELPFQFDTHVNNVDPLKQLLDFLESRSTLLILDGIEHMIEGVNLLIYMMQNVKNLMLLVTSRQKLNIQGEWVHVVNGLSIPDQYESQAESNTTALDLFIARASQTKPGYTPSEAELMEILRICHLVEGLPLGIELAAAWISVLSCAEIADEIESTYDFLAVAPYDVSSKHSSLRVTFEYSWQMIDDKQKDTLMKLSVFCGGFTRQNALQISGSSITTLAALLNASMLSRNATGRFDMHNVIRQYAGMKLQQAPKVWKETHMKHSHVFTNFLSTRVNALHSPRMVAVREEVREELENIRSAIHWMVLNENDSRVHDVISDYFAFCLVHGWHEGVTDFSKFRTLRKKVLLNQSPENDPITLSINVQEGWFCATLGRIEQAETLSRPSLEPLKDLNLIRELAICLHNLGVIACERGEYELAESLLKESIRVGQDRYFHVFPSFPLWLGYVYFLIGKYEKGMASLQSSYNLFYQHGDIWGTAFALSKMGLAADGLGHYATAMDYNQKALEIFLKTGDQAGLGYALSRLSVGAFFLEDYDTAVHYAHEAHKHFEIIGHRWGVGAALCRMGFAELAQDKIIEAKSKFIQGLSRAHENQMVPLMLYALSGIACVRRVEGKLNKALELFNYIRHHPQTPTIYIDIAMRWFQDIQSQFRDSIEDQELLPINQIIEDILV